ncbi:MAG: hypothetical protein K5746_05040 [Clostridiales bacterium]|nr:hypothetical protein [Clostridiales bacterium]
MTNRRHVIALLLCIGFLFALTVSSAYVVHEAGHFCSGSDCAVCKMIAVNGSLLRVLGLIDLLFLALFALSQERSALKEQERLCLPASGTLVSWKIRLND